MSNVSHSAIARCVNQPANFAVVTDGPGAFDQFEGEGFGIYQVRVRCECLESLWVPKNVGVSIMEDDAGVENL